MLDFEVGNSEVYGHAMCHVPTMEDAVNLFADLREIESELSITMEVAVDDDGEVTVKFTMSGFGQHLHHRPTMRQFATVLISSGAVDAESYVVRRELDGEEERASITGDDLFFSRVVGGVDTLEEVYTNGVSHYV